jgi:hypothetical protein
MKDLDSIKKELAELATVVNAFTSEAVQLRVLEYVLESDTKPIEPRTKQSTPRRRRVGPKSQEAIETKAQAPKVKKGRPSAATQLEKLLEEGFFNKKRTISEMISHMGTKKGQHFKANEISPPLLRFVRDQKLEREKNADDQYEYVKK